MQEAIDWRAGVRFHVIKSILIAVTGVNLLADKRQESLRRAHGFASTQSLAPACAGKRACRAENFIDAILCLVVFRDKIADPVWKATTAALAAITRSVRAD